MSPQPCRLGTVTALVGQRAEPRHGGAKRPGQDHGAPGGGIQTRTRAVASLPRRHLCARRFALHHVCFSKTWPVRKEHQRASKSGSTEAPHMLGAERRRSPVPRAEAGGRPAGRARGEHHVPPAQPGSQERPSRRGRPSPPVPPTSAPFSLLPLPGPLPLRGTSAFSSFLNHFHPRTSGRHLCKISETTQKAGGHLRAETTARVASPAGGPAISKRTRALRSAPLPPFGCRLAVRSAT